VPAWKPPEAQAAQSSLSCTWLGATADVDEWAEIAAMYNILHKRFRGLDSKMSKVLSCSFWLI